MSQDSFSFLCCSHSWNTAPATRSELAMRWRISRVPPLRTRTATRSEGWKFVRMYSLAETFLTSGALVMLGLRSLVDGTVIEQIGVGIVAVDFHDFGDIAAPGPALELDHDVN